MSGVASNDEERPDRSVRGDVHSGDGGAGDEPSQRHRPPDGVTAETVAAVGKLSEAFETIERARGCLYSFHQLTGSADLALGESVNRLREAGHGALADRIDAELVGRNVLAGRWTFQIVEEYDAGYYRAFQELERQSRDQLVGGRRHVFESEMKEDRRTRGRPGHEARP